MDVPRRRSTAAAFGETARHREVLEGRGELAAADLVELAERAVREEFIADPFDNRDWTEERKTRAS